jgi:hypothetical protein
MRYSNMLGITAATLVLIGTAATAQTPASDPSARLKEVLPPDVATRVLAVIAKARSRELPAEALQNRALKFAAKGVKPEAIERSVVEQEERMERARESLQQARGHSPDGDEVEAGAEALRKGVDGAKVSELAKSAPAGRSLAVPLYVIGSLVERGLPSDEALKRVLDRLAARASDRDLENMPAGLPAQAVAGRANKPAETGRALGETKHPGAPAGAGQSGSAGGPPPGVPANGGARGRPTTPPGQTKKPPQSGRP